MSSSVSDLVEVTPSKVITFDLSSQPSHSSTAPSVIATTLRIEALQPDTPLLYKVKTTAPRRYCVKPNSGVLQAKEILDIEITMDGAVLTEARQDVEKDKFLLNVSKLEEAAGDNVVMTTEADVDYDKFWHKVPAAEIKQFKFKVAFDEGSKQQQPSPPQSTASNLVESISRSGPGSGLPAGASSSSTTTSYFPESKRHTATLSSGTIKSPDERLKEITNQIQEASKKLVAKSNELVGLRNELKEIQKKKQLKPEEILQIESQRVSFDDLVGVPIAHTILMFAISLLIIRMVV